MKEKDLQNIQDQIKETTDRRALAWIARIAIVRISELMQCAGTISDLTLEIGCVDQIDYDPVPHIRKYSHKASIALEDVDNYMRELLAEAEIK